MAYTPINWQNGDTITAAKLNRCDNGWSVETSSTQLCSETVTTVAGQRGNQAVLAYATELSEDTLVVTWDGTDYTCVKGTSESMSYYGGIDPLSGPTFTVYPFGIVVAGGANMVFTENAGTYTIVIATVSETIETSDNFGKASQAAIADALPLKIELGTTTWQEAYDAMIAGRMVYVIRTGNSRIGPVIYFNTSNYSVVCLSYSSGSLTTITYYTSDGTANGALVE